MWRSSIRPWCRRLGSGRCSRGWQTSLDTRTTSRSKNDEQIDESLRSVLFEFPGPDTNPQACFADPTAVGCYHGVEDLAAVDVQRAHDHGIPTYNQLRKALGLPPRTSFTQITGESSDRFPANFGADPTDNPAILDFTSLRDLAGRPIASGDSRTRAVYATRASTLAARLRAIYGSVDNVDAFVGMISEPHVSGTEFGELQLALWKKQFEPLRDGDRFFYLTDPLLAEIQRRYGISYRHTLAQLIALNTDVPLSRLPANVFFAPGPDKPTGRHSAG
jgi:Animal haem peroxidase